MDKKSFFKQYFEIEANSSLPHAEDAYKDFDFDIMISNPIGKEPYIVVFTPVKDKESLSLIVELPQNECDILIFFSSTKSLSEKVKNELNY